MKYILYISTLLITLSTFAQEDKKYIREGNKLYNEKKYEEANDSYKKALEQ